MLCTATMLGGMALLPLSTVLVIHAIGTPIFFSLISILYFTKFGYTSPLLTAAVFLGFIVVVDFFIVALLINRSLEMFASPLGTWIPFALIFISTFATGSLIRSLRP
jgi:hypothetical protein